MKSIIVTLSLATVMALTACASNPVAQEKKAVDALLRRGHTYGQIRAGLQELALDTEDFRED